MAVEVSEPIALTASKLETVMETITLNPADAAAVVAAAVAVADEVALAVAAEADVVEVDTSCADIISIDGPPATLTPAAQPAIPISKAIMATPAMINLVILLSS